MKLIKTEDAEKAVVFLRPRDPLLETWNGRRLGVERAPQKLNVDEAYSIDDFKSEFPKLTEKLTALYHVADRHPWGDKLLAETAVKFYAVFEEVLKMYEKLEE